MLSTKTQPQNVTLIAKRCRWRVELLAGMSMSSQDSHRAQQSAASRSLQRPSLRCEG